MNKDKKSTETGSNPPPKYEFLIDAQGKIEGSHYASVGHSIIVNNKPGETYHHKVYANHKGHNGTRQLVNHTAMTVGTEYKIHGSASGKDYMITATQPPEHGVTGLSEETPPPGSNGDLYVGSTR